MSRSAHKKAIRQYKAGTPERAAIEAITAEQFAKGGFELTTDTKMLEGSEERTVIAHHMQRKRPVKALERLDLEDYQLKAAIKYDNGLLARVSGMSHEIREWVQTSKVNSVDARVGKDSDAVMVEDYFKNGKTLRHKFLGGLLFTIFVGSRGESIKTLSGGSGRQQERYANHIRDLMDEMARVYGFTN